MLSASRPAVEAGSMCHGRCGAMEPASPLGEQRQQAEQRVGAEDCDSPYACL